MMDQWEGCKALCEFIGSENPEMDAYAVQVFMNESLVNDETTAAALALAKHTWDAEIEK